MIFLTIFLLCLVFFSPFTLVSASEEENIDTFATHPKNRWTVIDDDADIDTVDIFRQGLRIEDVGDGTTDYYEIQRSLQKLDGKIEFRFKFDSNISASNFKDRFYLGLTCDDWADEYFAFNIRNIKVEHLAAFPSFLQTETVLLST